MFSPIGCSFSAAIVLDFARPPACMRSGSLFLRIYFRRLPSIVLLPPPSSCLACLRSALPSSFFLFALPACRLSGLFLSVLSVMLYIYIYMAVPSVTPRCLIFSFPKKKQEWDIRGSEPQPFEPFEPQPFEP